MKTIFNQWQDLDGLNSKEPNETSSTPGKHFFHFLQPQSTQILRKENDCKSTLATDRQSNGRTDRLKDWQLIEQIDIQPERGMEQWTNGHTDRQINGQREPDKWTERDR